MNVPCSPTPAGPLRSDRYRASMLPYAFSTASALARTVISGLNHTAAHSLSTLRRVGCPTTTQDSLPDGWPAFPGGVGYPQGSNERFQVTHSPFPGFAWRTEKLL